MSRGAALVTLGAIPRPAALVIFCRRCSRRRAVDLKAAIAEASPGITLDAFGRKLRCRVCGAKDPAVAIQPVD